MNNKLWMIGLAILALGLAITVFSCGSDDNSESDGDATPTDCSKDMDCASGEICGTAGTCETCTPCEVRADCGDPEKFSCDTERGCCKSVGCGSDLDCDEPLYCIDLVCRVQTCESDEDCTRAKHNCQNGQCGPKECEVHSDCPSNLCDLETFRCRNCVNDTDCAETEICSNGKCIINPFTDGDGVGELQGCEEFANSCLIDRLLCFDKINPMREDESFVSCQLILDGEEAIGYAFSFDDGSNWRWYRGAEEYWEAFGVSEYCYKIKAEDLIRGIFGYYNETGDLLATYQIDEELNFLKIICASGETEWYNLTTLKNDKCPGFPYVPTYSPPPPGIEGCGRE